MLEAYAIREGINWRAGVIGRHRGESVRLSFGYAWSRLPQTRGKAARLARHLDLLTDISLDPQLIERLASGERFRVAIGHDGKARAA